MHHTPSNQTATSSAVSRPHTILLTGATGFIGRWLLRQLTAQGHRVLALMRRPESQQAELAQWLDARGGNSRFMEPVRGDLEADGWGLAADDRARLQQVDAIFHLATRFAWNLDAHLARRANVDSLQTLLELVDANADLQRLVWVGGYMVGSPRLQPTLAQLEQGGDWQSVYRCHGGYEAGRLRGTEAGAGPAQYSLDPGASVHRGG